MRTTISRRIISFLIVYSRLPFLWLFFAVFRRRIKLKFFKPDSVFAVDGIPVRLHWYVRNAWSVHISGIGYVTGSRGSKIIRAEVEGPDTFPVKNSNGTYSPYQVHTLVAKGIGGTVTATVRINVVAMRPERIKARVTPLKSQVILKKLDIRLGRPEGNNLVRPKMGLFMNEREQKNELLLTLEKVRAASDKEELKKIS